METPKKTGDFMEIQAVGIHRLGGENDPNAKVSVCVQDTFGEWREIGTEKLSANFSTNWSLPACWRRRS